MQAFDPPDDTPPELDDFAVDWSAAVLAATPVPESHHPYLEAIARYSNNEDGIFALELRLADVPALGGCSRRPTSTRRWPASWSRACSRAAGRPAP